MENEFVPMNLALRIKELGFDEPCMAIYSNANPKTGLYTLKKYRLKLIKQASQKDKGVKAPTWHSAFDWFREKYEINVFYWRNDLTDKYRISEIKIGNKEISLEEKFEDKEYKFYEEAELAGLIKLIEIVESKTE
jgi:hypothetical protein